MRHLTLCLCLLAGSAQAAIDFTDVLTMGETTYSATMNHTGGQDTRSGILPLTANDDKKIRYHTDLEFLPEVIPTPWARYGLIRPQVTRTLQLNYFNYGLVSSTLFSEQDYASGDRIAGDSSVVSLSTEFTLSRPMVADITEHAGTGPVYLNGEQLEFTFEPFSDKRTLLGLELDAGTYTLEIPALTLEFMEHPWPGYAPPLQTGGVGFAFRVPEPSSVVLLVVASFLCRSVFRAC